MKKRVQIIPEDGLVIVDGIGHLIAPERMPLGVHAVQWFPDETGIIETAQGDNITIDTIDDYADTLAAWQEIEDAQNAPLPLDERRALRQKQVKAEAGAVIVTRYPEHRQRNMLARWLDIKDIAESRALTATEAEELDAMRAVWGWIGTVRDEENRVFQEIETSDDPETVHANWPE